MATQIQSLTGLKRLRPNQTAAMRAKLALLPQKLAKMNQKMATKNLAQQDKAARTAFGLEVGKMGLNLGMGSKAAGSTRFGDLLKNPFAKGATSRAAGETAKGGALGNLSVGSSIGSGLTGFGAAKLVGGKSKIKKGLVGAAAGGLLGLIGGGGGNALAKTISGGLFGGFGGMFG